MNPTSGHDGPYAAPVDVGTRQVPNDWIDYNGHMNVSYYSMAFDTMLDVFLEDQLGLGEKHAAEHRQGPYTLQNNLHYLDEFLEGQSFYIRVYLVDHDAKRMHVFMEMLNEDGEVGATSEQMLMNVDLNARRSAPYPDWALERMGKMQQAHDVLARPKQLGAVMGIRRKG